MFGLQCFDTSYMFVVQFLLQHLAHAAAVEAVKKVKASEWKPATVEPISVLQASLFNDCDAERCRKVAKTVT